MNDKFSEEIKKQQERLSWIISGLNQESYEKMTDWEILFIESVEKQSNRGRLLSNKQMEIIERIHKEKGQ